MLSLPRGLLHNREYEFEALTTTSSTVTNRHATFSSNWFATAQATTTEGHTAICDGRLEPLPGAVYSAVGHVNYGVGVNLRADIGIWGGCEVNLPIEVCICISLCSNLRCLTA